MNPAWLLALFIANCKECFISHFYLSLCQLFADAQTVIAAGFRARCCASPGAKLG